MEDHLGERVSALVEERGGRKGPPILWDGPLGPESFPEAVYEFPIESKSDFSDDSPLRGYDPR